MRKIIKKENRFISGYFLNLNKITVVTVNASELA